MPWTQGITMSIQRLDLRDVDAASAKRGFDIVGQTEFLGHTLTGMVRQPLG